MAYRTVDFTAGEWYHCYTRTIDRSRPFENPANTERFLETLYLANDTQSMPHIPKLHRQHEHEDIFDLPHESPLVAIGAYCLMPTHYHLLIQPRIENGLSLFMHKIGVGFTKFFNERNERVGNLFIKPFRAKHVGTDQYLDRIVQYIHLNPAELFEPDWKRGTLQEPHLLPQKLRTYEYSSLYEHERGTRPQSSILSLDALDEVRDNTTDITKVIADAADYYRFLELDL